MSWAECGLSSKGPRTLSSSTSYCSSSSQISKTNMNPKLSKPICSKPWTNNSSSLCNKKPRTFKTSPYKKLIFFNKSPNGSNVSNSANTREKLTLRMNAFGPSKLSSSMSKRFAVSISKERKIWRMRFISWKRP